MRLAHYAAMPGAGALMTPFPHTVAFDTPIPEVVKRMQENDFRHLPVIREGRLVGILSIRDVERLAHPGAGDPDPEGSVAHQVMTLEPFVVGMDTSLAFVLRGMHARRLGTALVAREGKLVGIITTTDVCRAFAEVLEDRFGPVEVA